MNTIVGHVIAEFYYNVYRYTRVRVSHYLFPVYLVSAASSRSRGAALNDSSSVYK
jgi:hypothetical protein